MLILFVMHTCINMLLHMVNNMYLGKCIKLTRRRPTPNTIALVIYYQLATIMPEIN